MPARVPRLQAQARPKACRVPGTTRLARAMPSPWQAVPACSRAGLFGPTHLASYTLHASCPKVTSPLRILPCGIMHHRRLPHVPPPPTTAALLPHASPRLLLLSPSKISSSTPHPVSV